MLLKWCQEFKLDSAARVIFLASVPFTAHFFAEGEREDEDDGGIGAEWVREKSASVIVAQFEMMIKMGPLFLLASALKCFFLDQCLSGLKCSYYILKISNLP